MLAPYTVGKDRFARMRNALSLQSVAKNNECKVEDLLKLNKVLRSAKKEKAREIVYQPLDWEKVAVLTFHDASFATVPGQRSQAGRITFLTEGTAEDRTVQVL